MINFTTENPTEFDTDIVWISPQIPIFDQHRNQLVWFGVYITSSNLFDRSKTPDLSVSYPVPTILEIQINRLSMKKMRSIFRKTVGAPPSFSMRISEVCQKSMLIRQKYCIELHFYRYELKFYEFVKNVNFVGLSSA